MGKQIQLGELQEKAEERGINPDQSYSALKEALDVETCDLCNKEYIHGWSGVTERFCSEGCELQHIKNRDY